ncbi:hypothetical protein B0H34DRAFT_349629 [Crassisporium funariophilum]|nr:hypothetical protein B0H34DRAFT_349629 [Crassisporium funariophilum]
MRHEFLPSTGNDNLDDISKTHTINLDLSSRSKIVIHAQAKDTTKQRTSGRTLLARSIFKTLRETVAGPSAPKCNATPEIERRSSSVLHRVTPITMAVIEGKRVERLARVKEVTGRIEKKPVKRVASPPRSIQILPSTPIQPKIHAPSPYADEYAKCGCTKNGGETCPRCRLMQLSDRFCDLVDFQCEKWRQDGRQ